MSEPAPQLYLDAAATTPVRREALEAMWPFLTGRFGNPSSVHALGEDAARALEAARAGIAEVLGARPAEVVLTGGGTEADNFAVKGIALARRESLGAHRVVVSAVEHSAVLESARWLGRLGFEVVELAVDEVGRVLPGGLEAALAGGDVAVCSVQLANNEVGTIQPVAALAALCRAAGVPLHTDAVQAAGWLPLDVATLGVDALSLSGHKVGGPRGTGALWVRRGLRLEPLLHGGGQERGLRSGTEDVAGAVGFAVALRLAEAERLAATPPLTSPSRGGSAGSRGGSARPGGGSARPRGGSAGPDDDGGGAGADVVDLRDAFVARVLDGVAPLLPQARLTGDPVDRLPGHASFVLGGVSGESVLLELERRGVLSSSGSACHAGSDEPSHVLTAMGLDGPTAQTALRFTWGRGVGGDDLDRAADAVADSVAALAG